MRVGAILVILVGCGGEFEPHDSDLAEEADFESTDGDGTSEVMPDTAAPDDAADAVGDDGGADEVPPVDSLPDDASPDFIDDATAEDSATAEADADPADTVIDTMPDAAEEADTGPPCTVRGTFDVRGDISPFEDWRTEISWELISGASPCPGCCLPPWPCDPVPYEGAGYMEVSDVGAQHWGPAGMSHYRVSAWIYVPYQPQDASITTPCGGLYPRGRVGLEGPTGLWSYDAWMLCERSFSCAGGRMVVVGEINGVEVMRRETSQDCALYAADRRVVAGFSPQITVAAPRVPVGSVFVDAYCFEVL